MAHREFTKEEENFILENHLSMTYKELQANLKNKFNCDLKLSTLITRVVNLTKNKNLPQKEKFVMQSSYSEEMKLFLIENYKENTLKELCKKFEQKFGVPATVGGIKKQLSKLKSKYGIENKTHNHNYTKEQDEWLIRNVDDYDYTTLSKKFNERFDAKVDRYSIRSRCVKGLKIKAINYHNKKNFTPARNAPIGQERIIYDSYIIIKTKNDQKNVKDNWELKHRYIWEQYHGKKVPEGHVITFLDGNNRNFDINNLVCLSTSELAALIKVRDCSNQIKKLKLASFKLNKILSELDV